MANKQMVHVHKNLVGFYSKLETFRTMEEFTDVTVECENESFRCHRLTLASASTFFKTMFCSDFLEKSKGIVVLESTSANIFKEVLQFMYTGHVVVTSSNVYDMLEASEFFELPGLESLCVEFVKENKMCIQNTLDMFMFACKTQKKILIKTLSQDIADQIRVFSRSDKFLEMPYPDLNIIVQKWSSLPEKTNDEQVFGAIVRWVLHERGERSVFFEALTKAIHFENLGSKYVQFVFQKLITAQQLSAASAIRSTKPLGHVTVAEWSRDAFLKAENKLHMYVRCAEDKSLKVFSINNASECSFFCENSMTIDTRQCIQTVAVDDFNLYCLQYARRSASGEVITCKQSFNAYISVDMHLGSTLKNPPIVFQDVCMCPLGNNIYTYNQLLSTEPASERSEIGFNSDELKRGIIVYNCELDEWFPVPAMKKQLKDACMTEYNGILYLIGGQNSDDSDPLPRYAQTYDYRAGKWQVLPKTQMNYVGASCGVLSDKMYVHGGVDNVERYVERYDPKAGKWEHICLSNKHMYHHKTVSFSNKLWAFGGFVGGVPVNNFTVEVCGTNNIWNTSDFGTTFDLTGTVLDGVVFKPL